MTFTEFYCQTTGSNLNSGSTATDAATYTSAGGDSDGTSVFTPNDGSTPASSVNVGDFGSVYVTIGATVAVFVGRVTAVAAGVNGAITFSTTAKSGTFPAASAGAHTITCKVGGAWQGPNGTVGFPFNFITNALTDASSDIPRVNFKSGTSYAVTAAMTHANVGDIVFQGYTTTPGDGGRATIDGGTSGVSYTVLTISVANIVLRDFIGQNNGASAGADWLLLSGTGRCMIERVTITACRGAAFRANIEAQFVECEAYAFGQNNTLQGFNMNAAGVQCLRCIAHDSGGTNNSGFTLGGSGATCIDCSADTCTGSGFVVPGTAGIIRGGAAYNNTAAGILGNNSASFIYAENVILANNGTYGVNNSVAGGYVRLNNCAFFSNTSGQTNGAIDATGTITCSSAPMVDPANGNFLSNTGDVIGAGRGTYTQNAGSYTKTTLAYPDVGLQHQSGGGHVIGSSIIRAGGFAA